MTGGCTKNRARRACIYFHVCVYVCVCVCVCVSVPWFSMIIHDPDCGSVTLPAVMYETVAHWAQTRRGLYGELRKARANMIDDETIDEIRWDEIALWSPLLFFFFFSFSFFFFFKKRGRSQSNFILNEKKKKKTRVGKLPPRLSYLWLLFFIRKRRNHRQTLLNLQLPLCSLGIMVYSDCLTALQSSVPVVYASGAVVCRCPPNYKQFRNFLCTLW